MEHPSIKNLIEGCAKGDRNCQKKIYEIYYGKMMGVCLRYAKNREEAKDLLHDGFMKVFDNINKFNFTINSYSDISIFKVATIKFNLGNRI